MSRFEATFDAPNASKSAVRDALSSISDDDISVSSPVSGGCREAAVIRNARDGEVIVRVAGHDGDWTKTSTEHIVQTVESVDGVDSVESVEGGYEPPEDE